MLPLALTMDSIAGVSNSGIPPRTSLIIPTFERPEELERCFRSLEQLRPGFDEIIVADSGDVARTRRIAGDFADLPITVLHHPVRSGAQARNAGIERATGDILCFVDDDSELPPDYVAAAVAGFEAYPQAVGLTGPDGAMPPPPPADGRRRPLRKAGRLLLGVLHRLLLDTPLYRFSVLRSGAYGGLSYLVLRPHERQWLHGHHAAYRRRVFDDGLRFCAAFRRWSFNEDVMLSYQAYKRYGPGSLRSLPDFRLTHHASPTASLPDDIALRMMVVHRFVFWRAEVYGGSPLNLICYLYGQLGFALRLWRIGGNAGLPVVWSAYRFLIRHGREIAAGRLDFNGFVLEGEWPSANASRRPAPEI